MEDLSGTFGRIGTDPVTALSPSSMAGGNRVCDSARETMTAPGSDPVDPMPPADLLGDPTIDAIVYDDPVLQGADGSYGAGRPDPYSEDGGGGWRMQAAKPWRQP